MRLGIHLNDLSKKPGPPHRALDAYRLANSKEEAYDGAYRALGQTSAAVRKAELRLGLAHKAKARASVKVHEAAGAFVNAVKRAEDAYDAAEGAGALSQRGPTELNAVNRGSIGRQAEKADALQQWLQLAD